MERRNIHGTVLVIGTTGLLILGASGSGKSLLAAWLLRDAAGRNRFAGLVADDRIWLSRSNGRVIAEAPETIAGLLELRGFGPAPVRHLPGAVVDRVVRLVEPEVAPRLHEGDLEEVAGVALPCLRLAVRSASSAVPAITAWLDLPQREPDE